MSRSVRTLIATALLTGGLLTSAALPASAHDEQRRPHRWVEIDQVQYNAPGEDRRSNHSLNSEYFTIRNNSRHGVQLRDYTVTDRDGHTYTFNRLRLRSGQTVTVHTGFGQDWRLHRYQDSRRHLYDNNRGQLTLRNERGWRLDQCSWNRFDRGHIGC
ncbi:lamin tail domain-containing protein [Streptomyces sp. NPDC004647]|uniref:lamin tail domain-containing protein n=1 Tax=Streptomyces sp. NPDC004647 TaxID=3154671 RepID=UPI0033BB57A3